ncbi:NAD-binding protein [Serendipita vermifera]|nr:NAD-binding protein [Serendipita vermifera]
MPAISTSSKVLLTGASGFLGAQILKTLLDQGFFVRVAVRSESKTTYIRSHFHEYDGKFEFVIVKDITTPGAFDEAVKGVDGIIHTASPVTDLDFIGPAVNGTLEILESAIKEDQVKRVAITSSIVALWGTTQGRVIYTEASEEKDASASTLYAASKTLAEQAAWKFMKESNPKFDLVTLLPSWIWGPNISETAATVTVSNALLLKNLKKDVLDELTDEQLLSENFPVDVRDTAKLHVEALLRPNAGGNRILTNGHTFTLQHILNILNANPVQGITVPKGRPEILNGWEPQLQYSKQASQELLGAEYRSAEESIRDVLTHSLEMGWTQ